MLQRTIALLLLIVSVVAVQAFADELQAGTLSGQIMISRDDPMSDGLIYIYNMASGPPPSCERYWRVPDMVKPLDANGRFRFNIPAGEYALVALKRSSGQTKFGPPLEGDYLVVDYDDKKLPKIYKIEKGWNYDVGMVSGSAPFKLLPVQNGLTAITGEVQAPDGKPVEGVLVLAFVTPTIVGKPLFVSERSNKEGRFVLRVNEGGTYHLKVRDAYGGGVPRGGSIFDGDKDQPMLKVMVKTGEVIEGIKVLGKVFPGRGRSKE